MKNKPTLAIAKRLFKRRNPDSVFSATWDRKPVIHNGNWYASVAA